MVRGRDGNKKEGKKRTPVVLERWFGPKASRAECPGPEEEKGDPETGPERFKEASKERSKILYTLEQERKAVPIGKSEY